jgi:hypothetical protein
MFIKSSVVSSCPDQDSKISRIVFMQKAARTKS